MYTTLRKQRRERKRNSSEREKVDRQAEQER